MPHLKSPAFERNREPILGVLLAVWGTSPGARVLELASGPGQHVCYFAERLPEVDWQPTEQEPALVESIDAWRETTRRANVRAARLLDVGQADWGLAGGTFNGALAINFLHMVDEETVRAAMAGVARALEPGGSLVVYDCFRFEGAHVSASNARFDAYLRSSSPGRVYDFEEVDRWAEEVGLGEGRVVRLPANNQCVVWRRLGVGGQRP